MLTDTSKLHSRRRAIALGARLYNVDAGTIEEVLERENALHDLIEDLPDDLRELAFHVHGRMRHVPRDYEQLVWQNRAAGFRRAQRSWRRFPHGEPSWRAYVRAEIEAQRKRIAAAKPSPRLAASNTRRGSSESSA